MQDSMYRSQPCLLNIACSQVIVWPVCLHMTPSFPSVGYVVLHWSQVRSDLIGIRWAVFMTQLQGTDVSKNLIKSGCLAADLALMLQGGIYNSPSPKICAI